LTFAWFVIVAVAMRPVMARPIAMIMVVMIMAVMAGVPKREKERIGWIAHLRSSLG
jgi:hypothetical protein